MNRLELGLIGRGRLGAALETHAKECGLGQLHVTHNREESINVAAASEGLFLTVGPKQIGEALQQIRDALDDTLIISFAASIPQAWMQDIVGDRARVVRAMTDINFQQIMTQRDREAAAILSVLSEHELIQTDQESDLDAMTTLVGCLPGVAAWQFAHRAEYALEWLSDWSRMTEDKLGISRIVTQDIVEETQSKGHFEEELHSVATPGGVTASMVDAMKRGELNQETLFNIGMNRIQAMIKSITE